MFLDTSDVALRGGSFLGAIDPERRLLCQEFLVFDMKKSQFLSMERKDC
jgi:hypothetical protein